MRLNSMNEARPRPKRSEEGLTSETQGLGRLAYEGLSP